MSIALGIDLATAHARVVAVDDAGAVLAERDTPLPPVLSPAPDAREQQAAYLEAAVALLGQVASDLGSRVGGVRTMSVTGTSGTMVPCDDRGRPTGAALLYNDQQSGAEASRLRRAGIEATATSPMARIGRLHSMGAEMVLHTPDVVHAGLLGRVVAADTSHALKAGIDPLRRTWDGSALGVLGVPDDAVPELVHPGTVLGEVTAAMCERTGVPAGSVVVAGMTDGCTAQIAAGAVAQGDSVGVLGTTLVVKAVAAQEVRGIGGALYSHYAPDGSWWAGGASNVGAGAVGDEFGGTTPEALADLERRVGAVGPSPSVTYPLRGTGERFPFSRPDATGFTLGRPTDDAAAYRSFLEGVAFVERIALDTLRSHGVVPRLHHLAGGGSRSELWSRLRATVLEVPTIRARRASSAYGAALLALAATEEATLPEVVARTSSPAEQALVEPLKGERDRLLESFHRLRDELHRRGLLDHVPAPRTA